MQISGVGTLMTGINFVTTVLKMRAPGMSYFRMPMFCWTALGLQPADRRGLPGADRHPGMLTLDRYFGFHFFTNERGGNVMMFVNLIWAWGHPEVYILVLPAFGVFSEVFSTFSGKPLFGYRSMVIATMMICIISCTVWLHHFFTMGAGPSGQYRLRHLLEHHRRVHRGEDLQLDLHHVRRPRPLRHVPMLWSLGFIFTFVIGGMTGVWLAVPPADFLVHNSLFLVAHFHNVIIGGVVFGVFAGIDYWFPKAFGFRLDERWGKAAFWFAFIGFWLTFTPLYILGAAGHDPAAAAHRRPGVAALALSSRPFGVVDPRRRRGLPGDPGGRQHPQPREAARRHRRPLGRPLAGVGDALAAAVLQLRRHAQCGGRGSLLADQAAGDRGPAARPRAEVPSRSRCR